MTRERAVREVSAVLEGHWHAFADEREVAKEVLKRLESLGFQPPEYWAEDDGVQHWAAGWEENGQAVFQGLERAR